MRLKIFDKDEKFLSNIEVYTAINPEVLNGSDTLEFTTSYENRALLDKKGRVLYKDRFGKWREFIIEKIVDGHTDKGLELEVYCENSLYETYGDYIEDKRPRNVTANIALEVALEPTRWSVGNVDNLGLNSTSFYRLSSMEAIHKVVKVWGCDLSTRIEVSGNKIVRRYVDLSAHRGTYRGKRYEYDKDLISVRRTVSNSPVITALYGYGQGEEIGDGYGRRIDFKSVNDGIPYVSDEENLERWGRPNSDGTKSHVFGKVEFDEVTDKHELLSLTQSEYAVRSTPQISYECKVADLKTLLGKDHEEVGLGDEVLVIDKEFEPELRVAARVIEYTSDLVNPENDEVVLGNYIDTILNSTLGLSSHINSFRSKTGVWDRADTINSDGTINAQFLNDLVDELNSRMNSMGGYVYISENGQGLTTYDKPIDQDPTMAIQLLGGAFRIANEKLPNGEFNWRTFGDGNGFVADSFIGGLLKGGKVNFDLTNGTFLIGDSTTDYSLYFDGSTLRLGGDVSIDWGQIESKPWIPQNADDVGAKPDDWIPTWTEIKDKPTILSANDIKSTVITKDWIGTLGLMVGDEIQMGSNAVITWDNLSEDSKENLKGEDGKDGVQGPQGPQGPRGPAGSDANVPSYIKSTYIDSVSVESPSITGGTVTGTEINNGNGTFRVDANGNLKATNADITGSITSPNATITGGSININTGGTKTSRINLNYGATSSKLSPWSMYLENATSKVEIGLGGVLLTNKSTGQRSYLYYNDQASPPMYGLTVGNLDVQNFASIKALDVNGTLNVRNNIYVAGDHLVVTNPLHKWRLAAGAAYSFRQATDNSVYLVTTTHAGVIYDLRSTHIVYCTSLSNYAGTVHTIHGGNGIEVTYSSPEIYIRNTRSAGAATLSVLKLS